MLKISRKNIWKETGLFVCVDTISIHMNPDGDNGSDGEQESSDTIGVIVHDVKTSTCSRHSHQCK